MLEAAVGRKADQTEVRMALGRAYLRSGRLEEATREMIEAARLDPASPSAQAQAGLILNMRDQKERALPYMERALALDPQLYDVRMYLAVMYYGLKRYEDCEKALKIAITQRPGDPEPRRLLAGLYEELKRLNGGSSSP